MTKKKKISQKKPLSEIMRQRVADRVRDILLARRQHAQRQRRRDQQLADQKAQQIERDLEQRSEQYERMWDDEFAAQYDDDPNPYHGTYSEE